MSDTKVARKRNLPLVLLALAPALMLTACNGQEKQELVAATARAEEAAKRAEDAQHLAEAAAARARTDKLAAAPDVPAQDQPATEEQPRDPQPQIDPAPAQ